MNKTVLTIIFYLSILLNAFAQSESEEADKTVISANYLLTSVNFSSKYMTTGSILTWRDIYLQGFYLNVDFQNAYSYFDRSNIGVGFSSSFHGYFTDDDANNDKNLVYVSTTETTLLELKYEMRTSTYMFNPKLGFDFNMLLFKNYNGRAFTGRPFHYWEEIEGLVCQYDIYKLGFYGGVSVYFGNRVVYVEASGQVGIGFYLDRADWLNNPKFKSPVSFLDYGFSFRGGSDIEAGLKLGRLTFFCKAMIAYEINPGLGIDQQFSSNGETPFQLHFFELTRASLSVGLKVSF
jgi:hypothetical protein